MNLLANSRRMPNLIAYRIEDVCPMRAPNQSSGSNEYRWTPITRTAPVSSMTSSSREYPSHWSLRP